MAGGRVARGAEDDEVGKAAARMHVRSAGPLLRGAAPDAGAAGGVPRALARCDGADIVKRNAKKKNYLFSFPGGLRLAPGARVGTLRGLDTPAPTLDVEYPAGTLRLRGCLVFPKNALLSLRGAPPGRPVRVVDTYETVVVFSEWAWLGFEKDNPGGVPRPLPKAMRAEGAGVWGEERGKAPKKEEDGAAKKRRRKASVEEEEDAVEVVESDSDVQVVHEGSDGDEYRAAGKVDTDGPVRSNPRRGKRVDFAKLFAEQDVDDEDDDEDDDDDDEYDDEDDVDAAAAASPGEKDEPIVDDLFAEDVDADAGKKPAGRARRGKRLSLAKALRSDGSDDDYGDGASGGSAREDAAPPRSNPRRAKRAPLPRTLLDSSDDDDDAPLAAKRASPKREDAAAPRISLADDVRDVDALDGVHMGDGAGVDVDADVDMGDVPSAAPSTRLEDADFFSSPAAGAVGARAGRMRPRGPP